MLPLDHAALLDYGFGETAPVFDGYLKTATLRFYVISKKAKNVEKVGFSGRIRTYNKLTFARMYINLLKITPVFRGEAVDYYSGNSKYV